MSLLWNLLVRPVIALQDSEKAHSRSMLSLKLTQKIPPINWLLKLSFRAKELPCSMIEWSLRNPLGLAAGMDKKAENVLAWENLGFGFIEVGGFTAMPQSGNERPRMFRNSALSRNISFLFLSFAMRQSLCFFGYPISFIPFF